MTIAATTLRDNIAFGVIEHDDAILMRAVNASDFSTRVKNLRNGLDTYLGKLFAKNGIELSGEES